MAPTGPPLNGRLSTARHPKADQFSRPAALSSALPGARSRLAVGMGRNVVNVRHHAGGAGLQSRPGRRSGHRRQALRPHGSAAQACPPSGRNSAHPNARPSHPRRGAATPSIGSCASVRASATSQSTRSAAPTFSSSSSGLTVGPWAKLATLRLLRSILEMAREDGRIHINPAQGVSAGPHPGAGTPPLSHRGGSRRPGNCMRRPGRHRHDPGLHWSALVRTRRPARRRHRPQGAPAVRPPSRPGRRGADHRRTAEDPQPPCEPSRSPKSSLTHSSHGSKTAHQRTRRSPHQTAASSDQTTGADTPTGTKP